MENIYVFFNKYMQKSQTVSIILIRTLNQLDALISYIFKDSAQLEGWQTPC